MNRCINCGIAERCNTIGMRLLVDESILSIIREWITPQTANENDCVCQACWNLASNYLNKENRQEELSVGHRRVCVLCGRSLLRRIRYHTLKTDSVQECRIYNIIREWIMPRTVSMLTVVCHSCWIRASRASRNFNSNPSTSSAASSMANAAVVKQEQPYRRECPAVRVPEPRPTVPTIVLPDYFRPVETESRCFVEGCQRRERNRVTMSMRKQVLKMHNYYIPRNNRLCDYHFTCKSWDFLNGITDNINNKFTADHIQDMLSLKDYDPSID